MLVIAPMLKCKALKLVHSTMGGGKGIPAIIGPMYWGDTEGP